VNECCLNVSISQLLVLGWIHCIDLNCFPMVARRPGWPRNDGDGWGEDGAGCGEDGAGCGEDGAGCGEDGAGCGEDGAGCGEDGAGCPRLHTPPVAALDLVPRLASNLDSRTPSIVFFARHKPLALCLGLVSRLALDAPRQSSILVSPRSSPQGKQGKTAERGSLSARND
jgi:hypothetical protein